MNQRNSGQHDAPRLLPIGQVVRRIQQTHPAVSQSSLRFLEREGLIEPTRTPGGHRLFSEEDIERILQIKAWQDQRLSLDRIRELLAERDRLPHPLDLASDFLQLILTAQLAEARSLILNADALGVPLLTTFGQVLQPVLFEVGARWEDGRMFVAQEKETSELVRDLVAQLGQRHADTRNTGPTIVAGSVQGERHELGLRMLTALLRSRGCRVHYLGADVAHEFFVEAIALRTPDAVLLSAKLPQNVEQIGIAAERIRDSFGITAPAIIAGGEAIPAAAERVRSWDVTPITAPDFAGIIDSVLGLVPPPDKAADLA